MSHPTAKDEAILKWCKANFPNKYLAAFFEIKRKFNIKHFNL